MLLWPLLSCPLQLRFLPPPPLFPVFLDLPRLVGEVFPFAFCGGFFGLDVRKCFQKGCRLGLGLGLGFGLGLGLGFAERVPSPLLLRTMSFAREVAAERGREGLDVDLEFEFGFEFEFECEFERIP